MQVAVPVPNLCSFCPAPALGVLALAIAAISEQAADLFKPQALGPQSSKMTDITIDLTKNRGDSLGIGFRKLKEPPHCEVSILVGNGVAAKSGLIHEGDLLLSVNGINVEELSPPEVGGVLARHSTDSTISLKIRREVANGSASDLDIPEDDDLEEEEEEEEERGLMSNGHPTIVVDDSPSISPDHVGASVSPVDDPLEAKTAPVTGWRGGQRGAQRVQRNNVGALPEIEESTDSVKPSMTLNLKVQQVATKRHSLTPEAVRKPAKDDAHINKFAIRSSKSLDLANLPQWRAGSAHHNVTLHNLLDGTELTDRLHSQSIKEYKETTCADTHCKGSFMQLKPKRPYGTVRPKEEVLPLAEDFIKQYYESKRAALGAEYEIKFAARLSQVQQDIEAKGQYELTYEELVFGARTAWRNAPRCVNRIVWRQLEVLDARHALTPKDMYEAIIHHIKYANNGGNLRSTITVFPKRTRPKSDFRIWNAQLIQYAGYKNPDGSILGDSAHVEFTTVCIDDVGWRPPSDRTAFDVLPLVLQANGGDPEYFDIPPELILECNISHPEYDWFEDLGLKWYALPAVSAMLLDCGGLEFPGIPFNGWYMGTEIARDLGDINRYNMLKPIAQGLGLNTQVYKLWKDRAAVELNLAVLHSFQKANFSVVDHHSTTESFVTHMKSEVKTRGGCPADWVWIVPPISGSATQVFHQEMLLYHLSPSYEYQYDPWKYHVWHGKERPRSSSLAGPNRFKRLANMVKMNYRMYRSFYSKRIKATILFATETGRARNYANVVKDVFGRVFAAKVSCMEDYDKTNLEHEQLLIIVTSTFGSGDPPANGEGFGRYLLDLRNGTVAPRGAQTTPTPRSHRMSTIVAPTAAALAATNLDSPLTQVKYAVFGLGSRAYPNFCTFAHTCDNLMKDLGAEMIFPCGEGDELCGQEESFQSWLQQCYHHACEVYSIDVEKTDVDFLEGYSTSYTKDDFRVQTYNKRKPSVQRNICDGLKAVHHKSIHPFVIKCRTKLQSSLSDRSTILVVLSTNSNKIRYEAGDHIAIYPQNNTKMVNELISYLNTSIDPDEPIYVEARRPSHAQEMWVEEKRMPVPVTIREALTYYLDIANPPSPQFLKLLAKQATRSTEQEELNELAKGGEKYEDWKYEKFPSMVDMLNQFHSLKIDVTLLLQQLPLLQCRYYSISSSPKMYPNEVHATVAVVSFKKRRGVGPRHNGVCSTWLNRIEMDSMVPCVIRQAHAFRLPEDPRTPVIMVGPGTGIAPYRSFWQDRLYQQNEALKTNLNQPTAQVQQAINLSQPAPGGRRRRKTEFQRPQLNLLQTPACSGETTPSSNGRSTSVCCFPMKRSLSDTNDAEVMARILAAKSKLWGNMTLYFGCRRSDLDYIYKDELMRAKVAGALTDVHVAFSRDPKKSKTYVQHLIKNHADKIVKELMEERGHIYVCGDISMAADVSRTLQSIFEENAAMSGDEARRLIESMKDRGMYHEDIFGVTLKHQEVTTRVRHAVKKNWRILVTSDSGNPLQTPMTPGAMRLPSPSPMLGARSFGSRPYESTSPSSTSSYESSTMPSKQRIPKRPTVTVLSAAITPPENKAKVLDTRLTTTSHGKASLQPGLSIDDGLINKSSMKLITIEEPQKAILEPLSEVAESPLSPPVVEITVASPPAVEIIVASPPAAVKVPPVEPPPEGTSQRGQEPLARRPSGGKGRQAVTGPPLLAEKKPVERKKSGDKKVKRIRTKSKVETAL